MILGSSLGAFLLGRSTTWVCTRTQEKSNFSGWTKPHSRSTSMQAIDNVVDKSISILPDGSITPVASVADSNDNDSIRRSFSGSCRNLHVDMKKIDERFLRSDEQVLDSMMKVVDLIESSALLAAPTCHRMNDDRLSCEMLNSHSHIYLHTWPGSGVLCLNLFSCQDDSLVLILPKLTEIFHYHAPVASLSRVQWTYKERGNHDMQSIESAGDIAQFLQGWMDYDMKNLVASVSTKFQTIEIYDVINPRFRSLEQFQDSMAQNGSYESMHPELYRPDRIVYLDGIMQSRSFGEAAYHEALVHPAMFTHKSPKRVAIIGGGEGATLREVLKHNTVELVTMIEIDELMVNVSKQHLPEWSDCSMLVGSARSCFDDHRAELFYTDAVEWFIVHFGDQLKINASHRYDVIIMDAL
jgi:S-adenosylmethionine/arginine decarboxylase-like enzyme